MQIEIKIDEKCKEPKIIVMTDKMTDEVNAIIKRLSDEQPQVIAGFREDVVEVLEPSEIYRVFAESGKVFAETNHGEYALRLRLYEAEQRLDSTTPAALVKYLDEKPQIMKIFLHFDNDNAGRKASLALKTILPSKYEVIDSPPPCGKDYNDFLCFQLGIHRNKTKERTNER